MAVKKVIASMGLSALLLAATGCNLEKEVDVVMPAYANELVVECYLEAGKVPRLTVVESGPYLPATPTSSQPTISLPTATTPILGVSLANGVGVQVPVDVTVTLTLPNGQALPLLFAPGIDQATGKYFTHTGTAPLALQAGQHFALNVQDTRGRRVTGTTVAPTFIPIDSARHGFNGLSGSERRANFITNWTDPAATANYYRLLLNSRREPNDPVGEYLIKDPLFNGQSYTALTTYRFTPGDTLTATLFHMASEHYAFQESVRGAISANGNPFGQPARIRSTVQGGIGVFAVLVADRRTLILR
ncbi:MAG TPA: DUF4249 family protein [Hymenobacter sp.]|jgi:hypothetical protein